MAAGLSDVYGVGISRSVLFFHIAKNYQIIDFLLLLNHEFIFRIEKMQS